MVDGLIGTFTLQQQASFAGNPALTLNGGALNFDLSSTGADKLVVGSSGTASVSGTNTIGVTAVGSNLTIGGNYTLISAPSGLTGNFQFANGTSTANVAAGSNVYQLTLHNSGVAETVSVAPSPLIIYDNFSGTSGTSIATHPASPVNLPGGNWSVGNGTATYLTPNTLSFQANNGYAEIPTKSGGYTPPPTMTISAALSIGNTNTNGSLSRGMGIGFFASNAATGQVGEFYWAGGLCLDPAGSGGAGSALGQVELDQGTGSNENQLVFCPYNPAAFGGKAFSTSAFYTLSYTINTTTGQISNVSLSDGTFTDTADYQTIDNFNTSAIFTVTNTAYAGIINGSANNNATGFAQNFELQGVVAATVWTGGNSTTNWADANNWSGAIPGATSGTTNTDTATFNQTVTVQPTTIDSGRNVKNITFDTSNVSAMTVGTTTGNALTLTSGGTIQTTSSVAAAQLVNAPLVLEGAYTFTSGATAPLATLSFGGLIKPDASLTSTPTALTLNGSNTGANTISGALSDNGSAKLAVTMNGPGAWTLGGANSYTGTTTVAGGTLNVGSGSLGASPISISGGSLVLTGSAASPTISISSGSLAVNSGGTLSGPTITISGGSMQVTTGATVGNAAVSVSGTGTFNPQPGSGTLTIGSSGAGTAGATLSLSSGGAFSMVDGSIGTFNLQQQTTFAGNPALSLNGGTLDFELGSTGADKLSVAAGTASVLGANTIVITPIGGTLTTGTYPLISVPAGGLTGTFQFAGGSTSTFIGAGSTVYQLSAPSTTRATVQSVTVARSSIQAVILDNFSANGTSISNQAPRPGQPARWNLDDREWERNGHVSEPQYAGVQRRQRSADGSHQERQLYTSHYDDPLRRTATRRYHQQLRSL